MQRHCFRNKTKLDKGIHDPIGIRWVVLVVCESLTWLNSAQIGFESYKLANFIISMDDKN